MVMVDIAISETIVEQRGHRCLYALREGGEVMLVGEMITMVVKLQADRYSGVGCARVKTSNFELTERKDVKGMSKTS